MNEKVIVSLCIYENEKYYLTLDSIYAKWSSSLSDTQFFNSIEETRKKLELNFDKICFSLGNDNKAINKIKICKINLFHDRKYEVLYEEYFIRRE